MFSDFTQMCCRNTYYKFYNVSPSIQKYKSLNLLDLLDIFKDIHNVSTTGNVDFSRSYFTIFGVNIYCHIRKIASNKILEMQFLDSDLEEGDEDKYIESN